MLQLTSKRLEVQFMKANGNTEAKRERKKHYFHFPVFFQLRLLLLLMLQSHYVRWYEFLVIPFIRAPFFCVKQQYIYMYIYVYI